MRIRAIYYKYKAGSDVQPISDGITNAIDHSKESLNYYTAKVKGWVTIGLPPDDQVTKAEYSTQ